MKHSVISRCVAILLAAPILGQSTAPTIDEVPASTRVGDSQPPLPVELTVEGFEAPRVIDTSEPRFSWRIIDPDRGDSQTAYRIRVASEEALLASGPDLWDSGRVGSDRSRNVVYGGGPLQPGERYYWQVRTWDAVGTRSAWSEISSFDLLPSSMGSGVEGTARYVWDASPAPNDWVYLRREFDLDFPAQVGRVFVTAHDDYKLFVNGQLIGRGPAPSDPYDMMQVEGWDVTDALVTGENVFAAVAHFHGAGLGSGIIGEPVFLLHAEIDLTDGSTQTIVTDEDWKVLADTPWDETAPVRGPDFAVATSVEDYDGRLEPTGWNAPGFDDSSWADATLYSPPFHLRAAMTRPRAASEVISPVSVQFVAPGVQLVDFGVNSVGWPRMTVRFASLGADVLVWYSEEVVDGRIVRNRDGITSNWDRYVCRGDAAEVFEPDTKYNGFRYVEIEGYPGALEPDDIQLVRSHTDLIRVGSFSSANPLLDSIYDISVRTEANACQGVLVDCPQREQAQYTSDLVIQGMNLVYNFDGQQLLRKGIFDFQESEVGTGIILARAPAETLLVISEWTLHWPLAIWLQYMQTEDRRILEETYETLERVHTIYGVFRDPANGLLTATPGWHISDYPLSDVDISGTVLTPENCLYYGTLLRSADIADVLGLTADADAYRAMAQETRDGLNDLLFDGVDRYLDCSGSTQYSGVSSVFALAYDVVPDDRRDAVLQYVKGRGFDAAVYGGFYLMQVLWGEDEADHAYGLVNQQDSQWGRMLAEGATTTWEDWTDTWSLSHAWSAYPGQFVLSGLMGVELLSPGWKHLRVRPRPPVGLSHAEGRVPTPYGPVQTDWEQTPGGFTLGVEIPVNATAEIHVPVQALVGEIREGGTLVWKDGDPRELVPGVAFSRNEDDRAVFTVGSGAYEFVLANALSSSAFAGVPATPQSSSKTELVLPPTHRTRGAARADDSSR